MLSPEAVPRIVTLRAASPAPRRSPAKLSISVSSDAIGGDISGAISAAGSARLCRTDIVEYRLAIGHRDLLGRRRRGPLAGDETNAATARGAVMRSNSPVTIAPALSIKVASVAISTIGSFFG